MKCKYLIWTVSAVAAVAAMAAGIALFVTRFLAKEDEDCCCDDECPCPDDDAEDTAEDGE